MNKKDLSKMSDTEIEDWVRAECINLPTGTHRYRIGTDSFFYYTDREGFIEAEIVLRIKIRDYINSF